MKTQIAKPTSEEIFSKVAEDKHRKMICGEIIKTLHDQFQWRGDASVTIKHLTDIYLHWLDAEGTENNFSDKNFVSNRSFHILNLISFLADISDRHTHLISDEDFNNYLNEAV